MDTINIYFKEESNIPAITFIFHCLLFGTAGYFLFRCCVNLRRMKSNDRMSEKRFKVVIFMGFDVILYNADGRKVGLFELTENLHYEIFNSKKLWRSYLELRRLSDFYLTDETFSGDRLNKLITDLKNYKMFISSNKLIEYQEFIDRLTTRSDIGKVHIAGD